jgi:hypothetical protein
MKLNDMMQGAKGALCKAQWTIHKKKPELCLAFSIAATLTGVFLACRATVKAMPVMEARKKTIEGIEKCLEDGVTRTPDGDIVEYTVENAKKDKLTINAKTAVEVGKLFVLPAACIGSGIVAEVCGFRELSERAAEIAAAWAVLKNKFDGYRGYIRAEYGEEADRRAFNGVTEKTVEVGTGEFDESGKEITTTKTVKIAADDDYTATFSYYNSDGSRNYAWSNDMDYNLTTLKREQQYLTDLLKARNGKPVTLNEARERLGMQKTQTGQVVGWVYDPKNPNHKGDNQIIFYGLDEAIDAYKHGCYDEDPGESGIVIEFNVDGNVLYAM